jgi:diguanylate cyclase (GGDEF)-like protein
MKLLLVEDNSDDADFLAASLRRHQAKDVDLMRADTLASGVAAIKSQDFDVILLDLHLPDGSGMECVDAIQGADGTVPIVVLSGQDDEEFAVSILNKGVQDYLVKWEGEGHSILRSIRYAIERKRSELRLNYLAQYDALTGIPNRGYFHDQLDRAIARAQRDSSKVALFFLDLDQFKVVNDTLGHDAGDHLLKEMAERLTRAVRAGDVIARLGGDEFAVLLEGVNGARDTEVIAKSILDVVREPFTFSGHQIAVTTSIGITIYPSDNSNTSALVKNADIAMYQAKESGRNNFKFFTARMHADLIEYHQLENDIKGALNDGLFRLVYQPKVNLVTHRLQGLEALLRWDCPVRGAVSPSEFIPIAEESGHIIRLGFWVLNEACRTLQSWQNKGLPVVPVSVNVSARQFQQPDFSNRVAEVLDRFQLDPGLIELELTEGLLMEDTLTAQSCLRQLKEIGVRISIDDFGTGHSCLNYLRRFPIDVLKIDKSFVADVGASDDSSIIIEAIISLARSLKIDTVAEGVENVEQLEFLIEHGCSVAQGFLFGRPIHRNEIQPLLEDLRDEAQGGSTARVPAIRA